MLFQARPFFHEDRGVSPRHSASPQHGSLSQDRTNTPPPANEEQGCVTDASECQPVVGFESLEEALPPLFTRARTSQTTCLRCTVSTSPPFRGHRHRIEDSVYSSHLVPRQPGTTSGAHLTSSSRGRELLPGWVNDGGTSTMEGLLQVSLRRASGEPNLFGTRRYTVTSTLVGETSNTPVGGWGGSRRQNLASPSPLRCSVRVATATALSNLPPTGGRARK